MKWGGLSQKSCVEIGRDIYGDKVQRLAGALIIELCAVNELVLKVIDDMIVGRIMLRENNHMAAVAQVTDGIFKGGDNSGIPINADGLGVVEDAHGQRRDHIGQTLVEPTGILWLLRPEILKGIFRNLFQMHHLPCAPGAALAGKVQLADDGPVHLAVIAYNQ